VTVPASRFDFTAAVPDVADLGAVHFVAIGGAGMSGVARIMLGQGVAVSGSDSADSPVLADLAAHGATVHVGHDAAYLDGADTVVVSSAIRESNVELAAARARGLRVLHRAQALASTMGDRRRVAVAGANGKTTTTSLLVVGLQAAGLDPSFVIGGELAGQRTNAACGRGDVFVVEADESDGSFLVYGPDVAIVTSVQPDHLDFYGTFGAVVAAYRDFVTTIRPGGLLVVCLDDPGARDLAQWARSHGVRVLGYGLADDADLRVSDLVMEGLSSRATLHPAADLAARMGSRLAPTTLPLAITIPGDYNVLNATAVVGAAVVGLGAAAEPVLHGLAGFEGTRRRFERKGSAGGVQVVDDYAHNAGKVAAVVSTARRLADAAGGRLVVAFQPHLYSRTRDFADALGRGLAPADVVVVMDVYAAREDPLPGVSGALVADAVRRARPAAQVRYEATWSAVAPLLAALVRPGDLLLTVGAGDVTKVGPAVLARLVGGEPT
jgi:UDP-N-acetylmuramate--alanine ligase